MARPPSPDTIHNTVRAIMAAREKLANDTALSSDEQVLAVALAIDPSICPPEEILRRLVAAIRFAENREEEAKQLAKEMAQRARRYAGRAAVFRDTLLDVMTRLDRKTFSGAPYGTASVVPGQELAFVTDIDLVPEQYFETKTERVLKRQDLTDDLKDGVLVSGAVLSNGQPYIRITRERVGRDV